MKRHSSRSVTIWIAFVCLAPAAVPAAQPGDFDGDTDVDSADLALMSACRSRAAVPASGACQSGGFDFDFDTDIDPDDFAVFQRCFSGAGVPGNPACLSDRAYISGGCLYVIGTDAGAQLALRLRFAAPTILDVDFGNNQTVDFSFNRADFTCIVIHAGGGDDVVRIDEVNGIFTDTELTTINGGSGIDTLLGGSGGETFIGGDGNDIVQMGPGNDLFIWNPGDDTDVVDGNGSGDTDTVEVNGGNGAEDFTVTANGTRVRFDRINPAPFFLDIGTCEKLVLNANGGNDTLACTGNLAALIQITADGGAGDDILLGSNGIDLLLGGDNNDFIDGQQGNDTVFLGAGDDTFQWDPGDGSDTIEGQAGHDVVLFNGSNGSEIFAFSANGSRLLFTRNLGNIVMDADDIEQFDLQALGSADIITVNSLAGTDLTQVNIDLAGTIGGAAGDAAVDAITVNGTNGGDIIDVVGAGTSVSVVGLPAQVNITNSEGANDSLVVNTLGDDDTVTATTLPAGVIKLTVDGGAGNDSLLGSQGDDVFLGGDGDDFISGDNGNDVAFMGANNDVFQWNPGDGNDTIEGQDGSDTMLFFGSNSAENVDIVPNGGRVLFVRNVASVTMDLNDVERIDFRALGGADNIVIGDLSGTDMTQIDLDLSGPNGGGDGAADTVTVNGTNGADVFGAAGDVGGIDVFGLQATVNILSPEQANDVLTLNALGEDDVVNAASLDANGIRLTINGGLGDDVLIGGEGDDLFNGGDGNDTALMGAGHDTFVWNPGDDSDTLEGQAGLDTMLFNGANVAEQINVFANGGRVLFTRDIAAVTMDLNDVESIDFTARGGADTITINDLSGTDATEINLNLESIPGSGVGDGAADNVIVTGTNGDDVALVNGNASATSVLGLAAQVNIVGAEAANDRLTINALADHDVVDASGLAAGAIQFTANGGLGDDTLIGGAGNDTLLGGDNDDVLLGGPGVDVLFGGAGNDTLTGGDADDQVFGEAGNDRLVWNPGDDTDLNEGGSDTDTVEVNGGNGAEDFTVTANGTRVRFDRINPAPFFLDIGTCEQLVLNANGGNDTLACTGNLAALIQITADGGAGDDTLLGSNGIDLLLGGDNNDFIDGQQGNDTVFLGAGDDTFQWDPGDGSDTIEGQDGADRLVFNGSNGSEIFELSANGPRLRLTRNLGSIVMDVDGLERVDLATLGGTDTVTVNSLSGTDTTQVNIDLAGTLGGGAGDGAADSIIVNGTANPDTVNVTVFFGQVLVNGLSANVFIAHPEAANDSLTVNGLGGADTLTQGAGIAALIMLTLNQ